MVAKLPPSFFLTHRTIAFHRIPSHHRSFTAKNAKIAKDIAKGVAPLAHRTIARLPADDDGSIRSVSICVICGFS